MNKIIQITLALVTVALTIPAFAAEKVVFSCTSQNPNAVFTEVKLVKDANASGTDMKNGRFILFKSSLSGGDEIRAAVLDMASTPVGIRTLFIDNDEMKVSIFQSQANYALILEPKTTSTEDGFGTMLEFLTCTKP